MSDNYQWTRRGVVAFSMAGIATAIAAAPAWASRSPGRPRSLSFYNLHTGESLETTYWTGGAYMHDALADANKLLRDFRTNEVAPIDVRLLDLLHDLRSGLGSNDPFHVISGYRSPKTNARMAAKSSGVARKSLHMRGMAIDVRLPGRDLRHLYQAAKAMKRGGVGLYAKSDFVHLDVGRPRFW